MRSMLPALLVSIACTPGGTVDEKTVDDLDTDTVADGSETAITDTGTFTNFTVEILDQPAQVSEGDGAARISGLVSSSRWAAADLACTWTSNRDGDLGAMPLEDDGTFAWSTAGLAPGHHKLTLTVRAPSGEKHSVDTEIDVCQTEPIEDFNTGLPAGWRAYGNAAWDPGGWLEITGNAGGRAGSIYKVDRKVDPGDFQLEFRIATGGGGNTGADGYSVNVVNVADEDALSAYVNAASNGGCLGYGISTACNASSTLTIDSFHVEFDTWYNAEFSDPTQQNHIEITFDGHPELHTAGLWQAVPSLEDLNWRSIVVRGSGTDLTVTVDGATIIQRTVPGFRFDGGYIGVSGSTGWAWNYHRFDDLRIIGQCQVPP